MLTINMHGRHRKKFQDDGTIDPEWKPRPGSRKFLADGITPDPKYSPSTRHHKFRDDGTLNPNYNPDNQRGDGHKDKSRPHPSRKKDTFIGIYGQAINTGVIVGTSPTGDPIYGQDYVVMVAATKDGVIDEIFNKNGLSTTDCFDFLTRLAKRYPKGIFVGIGLSYDANYMLRGIPIGFLVDLRKDRDIHNYKRGTEFELDRQPYYLQFRSRKGLSVTKIKKEAPWKEVPDGKDKYGNQKYKLVRNGDYVKVNDVSDFFQNLGSFAEILGYSGKGYFNDQIYEKDIDGIPHKIIAFPSGPSIDLTRIRAARRCRGYTTLTDEPGLDPSSYRRDGSDVTVVNRGCISVTDRLSPVDRHRDGSSSISVATATLATTTIIHRCIMTTGELLDYCRDGAIATAQLMTLLRSYLEEDAHLFIDSSGWNGSGSCASALLRQEKVQQWMKERVPDPKSFAELYDAQLRAFSAGRFEVAKFGVYIGKVYHYDLHSAFPSVMPELPALTDGHWKKVEGKSDMPYSLSHVEWKFDSIANAWKRDSYSDHPYYPFFYRTPQGIYAPSFGEGWYWKPEVDSALEAQQSGLLSDKNGNPGTINIKESWEFHPYHDIKPFAFIREKYNLRKQWEKDGNPAAKGMKFTINAVWGKLIQKLGAHLDRRGYLHRPTYHNVGYAGYITSKVRAVMYDAIMQHPESVVMVAADGLYTTEKLDLPIGDDMGQFGEDEFDGIISVRSGVFWCLKKLGREPTDEEKKDELFRDKFHLRDGIWYSVHPWYQGFDKGAITISKVLDAWRNIKYEWDDITVRSTRFVGLGSIIIRNDDEPDGIETREDLIPVWGSWRTINRRLAVCPTGRRNIIKTSSEATAYKNLEDTRAAFPQTWGKEESSRYIVPWSDDQIKQDNGRVDGMYQIDYDKEFYENIL